VIPRSSKVERLEENIALFDFELSELEMAQINFPRLKYRTLRTSSFLR